MGTKRVKFHEGTSQMMQAAAWRGGVWVCPLCDYQRHKIDMEKDWFNTKYMREIILAPDRFKAACVVVVSECPECFELSWQHKSLLSFYMFPKYIRIRINAERKRMIIKGKNDWENSACYDCKKLDRADFAYLLYPATGCSGRSGSAENRDECDRYSKDKRNKYHKDMDKQIIDSMDFLKYCDE